MQKNLFKDFHDVLCRWVMSGKHTITLTQIQAELPTASRDKIKMMMRQAHRDGKGRAGLTVNGIPLLTLTRYEEEIR
jgi:hypothetical protein